MRKYFFPILLGGALLMSPLVAQAQTPAIGGIISYQGKLSQPNGQPIADGQQNVTFTFYEGGTAMTTPSPITMQVTTVGGIFNTFLGVGNLSLDPAKSYPYEQLGDALLELGDYDRAAEAFRQMEARSSGFGTQTRLARLALLGGDTEAAQQRLFKAVALALDAPAPSREAVAWARWQFGETSFAVGEYAAAERHYRDALTTFPGYHSALAALGRARAARGDLAGAIDAYETSSNGSPIRRSSLRWAT